MSEIESRPTRGRSSTRGGRGSYGRGGPRGGRSHVNGHATEPVEESIEDQGELGEMKKKYQSELGMLKDMFPDWTDTDLVFALEEAEGDIPATVDKITQGAVSQFSEVKKPKDRARSKAKEDITPASFPDKTGSGSRVRGRGDWKARAEDVLVALSAEEAVIAVEEEVTRPPMGLQRTALTFPHPLPSTQLRKFLPALML